jgi:hypothetical protein
MNIKTVLAKVTSGEELSEDEKEYLTTYEEPNLEAVSNAKGKKERLKLEKKASDLQALLDEKEAEIEEASAGSTELETMKRQLEKLTVKSETMTAELTAERDGHSATKRSNALNGIGVDWLSDVPSDYRSMVMQKSFDGIDTEDLSDVAVTKPILDSIVEAQSRFINSGQSGGAGSGNGETGKPLGSGTKWTREGIVAAQKNGTFAENRAEIMAEAAAGNIE